MSSLDNMFDCLKVPLVDLQEATNGFAQENIIKDGASGKIYKGKMLRFGTWIDIAARRFVPDSWRGLNEFKWEITMLCSLKHPNLATIVGFCDESDEMIIIYKFEANGSVHQRVSDPTLTWTRRLRICLGIARALSYIHYDEGRDFSIIHHNLKSSKILLDEEWEPKLYGFELSVMQPSSQRQRIVLERLVGGTYVYADPACLKDEGVSQKSDMYSLGVVLFEILCGKKAFEENLKPPSFSVATVAQTTTMPRSASWQSQMPQQTTPSFKDLKNIILSWKSMSEAKTPTPSYRLNGSEHYMSTMKSLPRSIYNDLRVLGISATFHYRRKRIKRIIPPGLLKQMDSQSLNLFSEAAYCCLKEQRANRPNIDQVISALEEALKFQIAYDQNLMVLKVDSADTAAENASTSHLKGTNLEKLMIEFDAIEKATEKFDKKYHIGTGGYGSVYKALLEHVDFSAMEENKDSELPKRESTVAIKRILNRDDKLGEQGFFAEIETLSSCRHPNVVSLLGFCHKPPHMILVYEHVPKGSLDDYLGNKGNMTNLTWVRRLKISIDIAHGLEYIHTTMDNKQKIIHRDIKSGNILLGENWQAKIADFGLSKLHPREQTASTIKTNNIAGTRVYLDPEYERTGTLKKESDVYSFGVVLFEILTWRLAYDSIYTNKNAKGLAPIVLQHFKKYGTLEKLIDPKLKEESNEKVLIPSKGPINNDSLHTFIKIGCQCLAETQSQRPTMQNVIKELKKALKLQENPDDSLRLSFEALKSATQDFNLIIGRGGYGNVYRGEILCATGPKIVAVKQWARNRNRKFLAELEILFEYKHENIICLIGYSEEKKERFTVYEYAFNGSLDMHVKDASLTWTQRLKISIEVATGLDFLHEGGEVAVIHRNIKSSHILLNDDWKAKIGGFGLSVTEFWVNGAHGTRGYVDPQYDKQKFLTKESDIYSFGVVLLEMMCGRIQDPHNDIVTFVKSHCEEGKTNIELVFEGIKDQIVHKSLVAFLEIAYECLYDDKEKRPSASKVALQLKKALELQEDIDIWEARLPIDYKEIIKMSKTPEILHNSNVTNKDLYNMFSKGIILQKDKLCLSISSKGERNEMVSATMFSYVNNRIHNKRISIQNSRFPRVVKMMDISNLRTQIRIKTQFLSPNVIYGAYLVFKFCEPRKISSQSMYVNLKYKMGSENLHAYFATREEDEWMMIELCRFVPYKSDVVFDVILESLSPYYCGGGTIYIEGIHIQVIDDAILKVKLEAHEKLKGRELVLKSNTDYIEITHEPDEDEKLSLLSTPNGKKCHMLPAKMVLNNSSDVKCFSWNVVAESRFLEVAELLSQDVLCIKCETETQYMSPDTDYACHLIFKLSQKCHGLHCPVKVQDVLGRRNKDKKFLYFRSPRLVNLHGTKSVPKQREDGLMEVVVWTFNSGNKQSDDHDLIPMNLKLRCYEGTISGLIVYGIEFRPIEALTKERTLISV